MSNPLEACSESDIRRFAACWLNSDKQTDWVKAAAQYDPKVKEASFKTVTTKAAAKALKGTDGAITPAPAKAKGGAKKRKAAGEDGEDDAAPAKKKGKGAAAGKGKKSKAKAASDDGDQEAEAAKAEESEGGELE